MFNIDNLTSCALSSSGDGILIGRNITGNDYGHLVPREDGTISVTNGSELFTSGNGTASYSYKEIIIMEEKR